MVVATVVAEPMNASGRPSGTAARVLVATLVALAFVGLTATTARPVLRTAAGCAASTPRPPAAADVNKALDAIGAAQVPVSYVFVIDTSGSVQPLYRGLRSDLRVFLRALGPQDQVGIVTFDTAAEPAVPLAALEGRVDDVIGALPDAKGDYSDIGLGLEQALNELHDAPAGQPGAVVLLTDGVNNPAPGSRYRGAAGEPAWTRLASRAAELAKDRPIQAYAVPLTAELSGVDLLCSVFPGAERRPVGADSESLSRYLDRAQTAARVQAADRLLAADRGQGVTIEWVGLPPDAKIDAGTTTAVLRLRNTAPHLPVVLDAPRVVAAGDLPDIRAVLPPRIELAPGATSDLPVTLTWQRSQKSSMFPGESRYETTLSLAGTVTSPLSAALANAGLVGGPVELQAAPTGSGTLVGQGATSLLLWVWLLLAFGLAGMVAVTGWLVPRMSGTLEFRRSRTPGHQDDLLDNIGEVPLSGWKVAENVAGGPRVRVHARRNPWTRDKALRVTLAQPASGRKETRTVEWGGNRLMLGYLVRHDADN